MLPSAGLEERFHCILMQESCSPVCLEELEPSSFTVLLFSVMWDLIILALQNYPGNSEYPFIFFYLISE